jgi:hypothetical protein
VSITNKISKKISKTTLIEPIIILSSAVDTTIEKNLDYDINAICNNCGKRFKSMRAITMHLKMTAARHTVNFLDHGNYDSSTGIRKMRDQVQIINY